MLRQPLHALVREVERVIVVDRDDEVAVRRQAQLRQGRNAVPFAGPDQHDAVGVRFTHRRQRARREPVPGLAVHAVVRLVEQFEQQLRRTVAVALRDLPPHVHQAHVDDRRVDGGLVRMQRAAGDLRVVVQVEDHVDALGQQRVDDLVHAPREGLVDGRVGRRRRVVAPAHRQAHRGEVRRRLVDERRLDAGTPIAFARRIEHVAQIDAAPERLRRGAGLLRDRGA
jgi:hypothetical protein